MQYKIIFLLIITVTINVLIAFFSFKVGYDDGFIDAKNYCNKAISGLTSRKEQEVIHEILGKYKGRATDNDSYDFNTINELFSKKH